MSVVILGGGIAGISAAYHLSGKEIKNTVYEASSGVGGLVSNFTVNGFRFDNAIHMSFSKSTYVKELFSTTPFYSHAPDAYCRDRAFWLKHPVQNNLFPLPVEEKLSYIKSFIQRPELEANNYKEWLINQYGQKIAEKYPLAYTHKYWGLGAEELSLTWIGDRMRKADIDEVLIGALEPRDVNHYYAAEMRYPKKGGYFNFIKPMVDSVNFKCNKQAVEINIESKSITFLDGEVINYDNLISSLPLPVLINIISNVPRDVCEAAQSLLWTTVDLVSVGFNKPKISPYLWFYLYDEDTTASRAYSPSMKSSDNAPEGKSSLQFEIYNLSNKELYDSNQLLIDVKNKILSMNICDEDEIEFMHHKHLPFGNVVFNHGMEERRKIIRDYLASCGIFSCGRFGEWDYLWSDQSLLSGKSVAEAVFNLFQSSGKYYD